MSDANKIVIDIDDTGEIREFIQTLNKHNLFNDIDFTWMYEPSKHDENYTLIHSRRVTFYFKESKNATWFSLIL